MRRNEADAATKLIRNLATNPNMEASSGTVNVRTNLCVNPNAETAIFSTAGSGAGTASADTAIKFSGTQSTKYVWTSGQWGFQHAGGAISVTASTIYKISLYCYVQSGQLPAFSASDSGYALSAAFTTQPSATGSWQRVDLTYTTGASQTTLLIFGLVTAASTFNVDAILVEKSSTLDPYFDGATSAGGGFTYVWAGTANASQSYQQAPGIATWLNQWFGASGGSGVIYQMAGQGVAGACVRKVFVTASTGSPMDTGISSPATPVIANLPYTFSMAVRASINQYFTAYIIWLDGASAVISTSPATINTSTFVTANIYTRVSVTGTAPANAVTAKFVIGPYVSAQPMPAGSWYDFDRALIVQTSALQLYFDGASPFCKWEGAANASISVGYPQQLVDLAGTPIYDGINVAQLTDIALPSGQPVTIYSVQSMPNDTNIPGMWELTNASGNWSASIGVARLIAISGQTRLDVMKTTSAGVLTSVAGTVSNLNVYAVAHDGPVSGVDYQINNGATTAVAVDATFRAVTAGSTLRVGSRDGLSQSTVVTTKRLVIYQGKHSLITRAAISRWLGSKYGVTVA